MGLDVYLRKCPDLAAAHAAETAAEEEGDALWQKVGGYSNATEAQRKEIGDQSERISQTHGLSGRFGRHSSIEEVRKDSSIDPEHLFKVGYFRSSYNQGGIERVLRDLGLPGLGDIFMPGDEYEFKPDWGAALLRVNEAITKYEAHLNSDLGRFDVSEVRPLWEFGVSSAKEAMQLFADQLAGKPPFESYSNRDGTFFSQPMKVRAFITKKSTKSSVANPLEAMLKAPAVYVIYEKERGDKEDWYLTALKIVRETIEHVLAQDDKQHYFLTWSG